MSRIISFFRRTFSYKLLLRGECAENIETLRQTRIRYNYHIMIPSAIFVILITVSFILSDITTGYWQTNYPYSILNMTAECLHILVGVLFLCSLAIPAVRHGSGRAQSFCANIYLALSTLGFTLYNISDSFLGNTSTTHYFMLILVIALPILTGIEFVIFYITLYILPTFMTSLLLGQVNVLELAVYLTAILLHLLLRVSYTRSELNRIRFESLSQQYEELSMQDALTQIGNRKLLYKTLSDRAADWVLEQKQICLVMLDIDNFKNYNDTYSHLKGDECLLTIAGIMKSALSSLSSDYETVLIRFGGEEFLFLIIGREPIEGLELVYRSIREQLKALAMPSGRGAAHPYVTVSMGAAIPEVFDIDEAVREADVQLYRVKGNGRDGLGYAGVIFRDESIDK